MYLTYSIWYILAVFEVLVKSTSRTGLTTSPEVPPYSDLFEVCRPLRHVVHRGRFDEDHIDEENNYTVGITECSYSYPSKKKWINMVKKYKELRNPPTGSGMNNGTLTPVTWPYYEIMDKVLGERAIICPPLLISSSSGIITENESQKENIDVADSNNKLPLNVKITEEPPLKKRKSLTEHIIDITEENNKKSDELITIIKDQGDKMLNLFEKMLEIF